MELLSNHSIPHPHHTPTIHHPTGHFPHQFYNEAFMAWSSSLLWLMSPGCGFFYSGMARSKSALSMMTLSLWGSALSFIQWFLCGYSLTFSLTSKNSFIGDFNHAFLFGVGEKSYPLATDITELSFCLYQGITCAIPSTMITGALAERARLLPALIFTFFWSLLVYNPCAFWSLNSNGWSFKLGVLDFGGGGPVHIPASAAAIVYGYILGPRTDKEIEAKPHNMLSLIIGTTLIWFASFGYNAGSAFGGNLQSIFSIVITNLAGCFGAVTWSILDYWQDQSWSAIGACCGAVVGLTVITPASGFVAPLAAIPISVVGVIVCRWGHALVKHRGRFDDTLNVASLHGLGGVVGLLMTGIFAQNSYGGDDVRGMIEGHYAQILYQLADGCVTFVWSFLVSAIVLCTMNKIPCLRLKLDDGDLNEGMDHNQMRITCYEHIQEDFLSLTMDYKNTSAPILQSLECITAKHTHVMQGAIGRPDYLLPNLVPVPVAKENSRVGRHNTNDWQSYWY